MNKLSPEELDRVIHAAAGLFLKNGIAATTVRDIAQKSGFGEASIYRHFGSKDQIAVRAALLLSERVLAEYFDCRENETGRERVLLFFSAYERVFSSDPGYFRLLCELDALYIRQDSPQIAEYEASVEKYHELFLRIYTLGQKDGTLRSLPDPDLFYYSAAHSLLNLCKFLAVTSKPLEQDKHSIPLAEIHMLCTMILNNVIREV